MNILKLIKNAWKLRHSISKYDDADYRASFNILREGLLYTSEHIKEIDDKAEIQNDAALNALKDYINCLNKIVKDKFIDDAVKMVLKDKFNPVEYEKNPFRYISELPKEQFEQIYEKERAMLEITLTLMHKIGMDRANGLTSWYTKKI